MSQRAIKQYIELYHLNGIADFFQEKKHIVAIEKTQYTKNVAQTITDELLALKAQYTNCQDCLYKQSRIKVVVSRGERNAPIFLIGTSPNYEENMSGFPFPLTAESGNKLNEMLKGLANDKDTPPELRHWFERKNMYISLMCKCKAGTTYTQTPAETKKCLELLTKEIDIVKPKIILIMGLFTANIFFDKTEDMEYYRNNQGVLYEGIPIYVTYNPSDILENPNKHRKPTWEDLQRFRDHCKKIIGV